MLPGPLVDVIVYSRVSNSIFAIAFSFGGAQTGDTNLCDVEQQAITVSVLANSPINQSRTRIFASRQQWQGLSPIRWSSLEIIVSENIVYIDRTQASSGDLCRFFPILFDGWAWRADRFVSNFKGS